MIFVANGCPKSGTHALYRAMELLGLPTVHGHYREIDAPETVGTRIVNISRHPKNVLMSWLRFNSIPVTEEMFKSKFISLEANMSFTAFVRQYHYWLTAPDVMNVRYEDLIASDLCLRSIATWAGVPYIEGSFEEMPGWTRTWNPVHSDWNTIWNPSLEAFWTENGGAVLEQELGYA